MRLKHHSHELKNQQLGKFPLFRDQGVGGSNPLSPTNYLQSVAAISAKPFLGAIRATGNSGSTGMWKPRPVSSAAWLLNSASALSDSTV